jgi:hypothetical protein
VIDIPTSEVLTSKSHVSVGAAFRQLEKAGILVQLKQVKWGRVWECPELLQLVQDTERHIATH